MRKWQNGFRIIKDKFLDANPQCVLPIVRRSISRSRNRNKRVHLNRNLRAATTDTATASTDTAVAAAIVSSSLLCAVHLAGARTECFGKRVERAPRTECFGKRVEWAPSQDAETENSNGGQLCPVRRAVPCCTIRSRKRFELVSELLQILLSFSCDAVSKAVVNQREGDGGEYRHGNEMPHVKREKTDGDKRSTDVRSAFGCQPAPQQSSLLELLPILRAGVLKF